ncbi:MAG: ComEC/Rec2 family competence protein [Hyphomonadaceae bacterium]
MALGAAAYLSVPWEPPLWAVLAATAIAGSASVLARPRGSGLAAFALGLLAMCSLGTLAGKVRSIVAEAPVLTREVGPVRVEGRIAEIDASDRSRRLRVRVHAIEGLGRSQTPKFVRFSVKDADRWGVGETISCRVILAPPPRPVVPGDYAFHREAYFQQLGGVGFALGACQPIAAQPPQSIAAKFQTALTEYRREMAVYIASVAGDGGGVAAAVISGDRSFISPDDAEALRASGLAHLLSISGLHMALAGGIFFVSLRTVWPLAEPLAQRAPAVKVAAIGAIIACTYYLFLSGAEVATLRAYIMAIIAFGAKLFDRPALSIRSLATAMFVAVLIQPQTVLSPGFQMSYAATGALIAMFEAWPRNQSSGPTGWLSRTLAWAAATLGASIVASTATAPYSLFHFARSAPLSVVANIATSPIISFWSAPAAAAAAIAAPFGLQAPFLNLLGQSLALVQRIADWAATASPDLDLPTVTPPILILVTLALAVACIQRGWGRAAALAPLGCAIALWTGSGRPIAYIAADASVFVRTAGPTDPWIEITAWRSDNGLNPMSIRGPIQKTPCAKTATTCVIETRFGQYIFEPVAKAGEAEGDLILWRDSEPAYSIKPRELAASGGAILEWRAGALRIRTAPPTSQRPWDR